MNRNHMIYAVLFAALLSACAGGIMYTAAELSVFPPEVQEHIKNSEVTLGMTRTAVRYAWGAPSEVNVLEPDASGKDREEWVYRKIFSKTTLLFTGGAVSAVTTKDIGAKTPAAKPKQ